MARFSTERRDRVDACLTLATRSAVIRKLKAQEEETWAMVTRSPTRANRQAYAEAIKALCYELHEGTRILGLISSIMVNRG